MVEGSIPDKSRAIKLIFDTLEFEHTKPVQVDPVAEMHSAEFGTLPVQDHPPVREVFTVKEAAKSHIADVSESIVGDRVGTGLGFAVGKSVEGTFVGTRVGSKVGFNVGALLGWTVG